MVCTWSPRADPITDTGAVPPRSSRGFQLNMAQAGAADAPVVAWHQGGPGGSSTQGGMIEMSYFQVDANGTHTNPHAWNKVGRQQPMPTR